jgi:hypothetical protein
MTVAPIDANLSKCLALYQFAISLVNISIHSLLRDIVTLDEKTDTNLLAFKLLNGKPCTIVNPICGKIFNELNGCMH